MSRQMLLVDDHPLFRSGVRLLLESNGSDFGLTEAGSAAAALACLEELKPEVVIMDFHLPDRNGIETAREILARFPATKIIILSGDSNLGLVDEALKAGISGYLLKAGAAEELPRAITTVLAGKLCLCPEANEAVLEHYRQALAAQTAPAQPELSPREREVLCLVAEGLRTKEIAARLNVGLKTIETFRQRLMKKVGCDSTADLVRYAVREGLIQP